VFWSAVDQHEDQKMMKLFPVSGNQNFDWRSVRVLIPIEQPTEGRVSKISCQNKHITILLFFIILI